ncbi:nucleotidyltransferase domain-containing protein [Pseudarthrobacter sp. PvP090]|uniref:nucleotidyltransferase domain-containing protein n=1 Tax=Pseudarthrobacter sp. PvP090 TaxID=3156393 RepID=UPI00339252A2
MDPASAARAFVAERHPDADAAILGGSAALGRSTPTSDLDIVVLYRDGAENYAETTRYAGWIVEAFIHTPASLAIWYARERDARCAVLGDLCAQGVLLTDRGPEEAWQREAQLYMDHGPKPRLTRTEACAGTS